MLTCHSLDLLRLLGDDPAGILEMAVNEFLVGDVDEWEKVDDAGAEECHAPHGEELDEVVGEERCCESL